MNSSCAAKSVERVLGELRSMGSEENIAGTRRFGIRGELWGISIPELRKLAKRLGTDHELARELWASGTREARLLASMIDDPAQVTQAQMEAWVADFNSWDICDQCCSNLFDRTPFGLRMARQWILRDEEFVKRAGFTMFATTAVHDKDFNDEVFIELLALIEVGADDPRNFVKKSVSWALRQIGKRNLVLNDAAVEVACRLIEAPESASRWVGRDALRELTNPKIVARIAAKD